MFEKLVVKDKVVTPIFNKPFEYIVERVNTINSGKITLQRNVSSNKAVIIESCVDSKNVLPDLESNQDKHLQRVSSYR